MFLTLRTLSNGTVIPTLPIVALLSYLEAWWIDAQARLATIMGRHAISWHLCYQARSWFFYGPIKERQRVVQNLTHSRQEYHRHP